MDKLITDYIELYEVILQHLDNEELYDRLSETEKVSLVVDCIYEVMTQNKKWEDVLKPCATKLWAKKRYIEDPSFENSNRGYVWDVTKKLDYEDILYDCIKKFGAHITSYILYLIVYAKDFTKVFSFLRLSAIEKYVILSIVKQLKGKAFMSKSIQELPQLDLSTVTEKAKFLSFMEGYNSDLLVCLLLLHSQYEFFQFLILFGGKSLKVPTLARFMEDIKKYKIGEESGTISSYFVREINEDKKELAEGLAGFLERGYTLLLEKYDIFLDDLIKKADPKNPASLLSIYTFFHEEMKAQTALIGSSTEYARKTEELKKLSLLSGSKPKKKRKARKCE